MNFKVGQTVRLIKNNNMAADIGATAVVDRITSQYVYVTWETNYNNQGNGGYYPHQFESVIQKGQQLLFSFMRE